MRQQRTQEHTDFLLTDVLKKEKIVEAQVPPLGTDRKPEMTESLSVVPGDDEG